MESGQGSGVSFLGPPIDERGLIKKKELRVGAAESLAVMNEEYAFFTVAVLYLHGEFCDGPLIDFMYERQEDVTLYYKKFNRPIFQGLETPHGDADWNHVLWAVKREHFQALADFIIAITFLVREAGLVIRFGEQPLTILDPLALDRCTVFKPQFATLAITAFGINSNKFCAAFRSGASLLLHPPKLTFFAHDPAMTIFAQAAFAGHNPIDAQNAALFAAKLKQIEESRK